MTALQSNPYADSLLGEKPASGPYSDLVLQESQQTFDPSFAGTIKAATQFVESQPVPDRSFIGQIMTGLGRGVLDISQATAGFGQAAAAQAKQLIGDNSLLDSFDEFARSQAAAARIIKTEYLAAKPTLVGEISEGVPAVAGTLAITAATAGGSIPAEMAVFGGLSAAQTYGERFDAARAAGADDKQALKEASAAAVVSGLVGSATAGTFFNKVPGAQKYLTNAASRFAGRIVYQGIVGETTGVVQRVATDAWMSALRDDPAMAAKIYNLDPAYWADVFQSSLPGAITMAGLGGIHELIKGNPITPEKLAEIKPQIEEVKSWAGTPIDIPPEEQAQAKAIVDEMVASKVDPETKEPLKEVELSRAEELQKELSKLPPAPETTPSEADTTPPPASEASITGEPNATDVRRNQEVPVGTGEVQGNSGENRGSDLQQAPEAGTAPSDTKLRQREKVAPPLEGNTPGGRRPLKERIRQAIMGPRAMVTMSEGALLKTSLRQQQRGAESATKAANAKMRTALSDLRSRLLAEKKLSVAETKQTGKDELTRVSGLKQELATLARNAFVGKPGVPHPILTQIAKVKTFGGLAKSVRKVSDLLDQAEHRIAVRKLKTILTKNDPDKMMKPFRAAFKMLTDNLDVVGLSPEKRARLESLKGVPDLPFRLVDEIARLGKTPIKDLDRRAALSISSKLLDIISQQKESRNAARQFEKQAVADSQQAMLSEVQGTTRERPIHEGQIAPAKGYGLITAQHTLDTLGETLGGHQDSYTHATIYDNLWNRRGKAIEGWYKIRDQFRDFIAKLKLPIDSESFKRWSAFLSKSPDRIETKLASGESVKMTRMQRVYLRNSLRDPDFHDQVLFDGNALHLFGAKKGENFQFTWEDAQQFLADLTPEEHAVADHIFRQYNGPLKDTLSRWSNANNLFDITSGRPYYTIHRVYEGEVPAKPEGNFRKFVMESSGLLKDRTGSKLPIEIRDALGEFSNYAWQVNGLAELAPAIRLARQTALRGQVRQTLLNSNRAHDVKFMEMAFDNATREFTGGGNSPGFLGAPLSQLMNNIGHAMIGSNPAIALYHVGATSLLAQEIPTQYLSLALSEGAFADSKVGQRMRDQSPSLRQRADAPGAGMVFEGATKTRPLAFADKPSDWSFALLNSVMEANARMAWRAAELQVKAQGYGDVKSIAERAINRTQITYDPINRSGLGHEASLNPSMRFFTMFRAQTSKMLSQVMIHATRMARGQGSFIKNAAAIVNLTIGNAVMLTAINTGINRLLGVKPDAQDFTAKTIDRMLGLIPGVGSFVAYVLNKTLFPKKPSLPPDISPIASAIDKGLGSTMNIERDLTGSREPQSKIVDALEWAKWIAAFAGVPVVWPIDQIEKLIKSKPKNQSASKAF